MKKYITNLYGHGFSSTGMVAQHMVTRVASQAGYSELAIDAYSVSEESEDAKMKRIEEILSPVHSDSLVIAQMPSWNGIAFDGVFLKVLRERVAHLVVFVQDFVPLMFVKNGYLMERYLAAYNLADLVVLPSVKMREELVKRGLTAPVVYQEMWDHVSEAELKGEPGFQRKLKFAGAMTRFPFVKDWSYDVPLEVFSDGVVEAKAFLELKGWQPDEELLRALHRGGFGLVWSEDTEEQHERAYSEMNLSFKFSTYLAAGLPIIVNRGLAKEAFVTQHGLGLVANSLDEVCERVKSVSQEEYRVMCHNAKQVGSLIRAGFFTRKLLLDIETQLFLEHEDRNDYL